MWVRGEISELNSGTNRSLILWTHSYQCNELREYPFLKKIQETFACQNWSWGLHKREEDERYGGVFQ